MKRIKLFAVIVLVFSSIVVIGENKGEEKKDPSWLEKGTVYGKVFANFHTSTTDFGSANALAIDRAYFGYKTKIDENFSAAIKLDVGADPNFDDDLDFSRYMYLKDAYLQYKVGKLTLKGGLAGTFQFKTQEKFWGYRYIFKSYQDAYKFGSSADIGIYASYKFSDMVTVDYAIMNGEGYKKVQADSIFKHALGLTLKPVDFLTLRAYSDVLDVADTARQVTASFFAGAKFDKFSIGAEYNYQMNNKVKADYDFSGFSVYATYKAMDKLKVFGRFDQLSSSEFEEDVTDDNGVVTGTKMVAWNKKKDGSFIIAGVEYSPAKKVNLALNYQHKLQADDKYDDTGFIYVNLQFAF